MKKIKKTKKRVFRNQIVAPIFTDKRGSIFDLIEEKVSHIGIVTFNKGAVRGNHYHKKSVQYSYVLEGKLLLTLSDTGGNRKKNILLVPGMLSTIPVETIHTYKALTKARIIDITTMCRLDNGYEKDTIRMTK